MGLVALLGAAFVKLLIAAVLSQAISQLISRDPKKTESPGTKLSNQQSNDESLKLLYGEHRTNINIVYATSTGEDNKYLHLIGILGEGPINGIVREDGSIFTSTGTEFPTSNPPLVYMDGRLWTEVGDADEADFKWSDRAYIEFFSGTDDQNVCSTLHSAKSEWTDCMRHTAYVYIRLEFDFDGVNLKPDITFRVSGLKCYDPTAETTAVTSNNALIAYDMMTRPSCRGGLGLDNWHAAPPADPRIDTDWIEDSREYVATKGWTYNAYIDRDSYFVDNISLVLECARLGIIYSEGVFKLRYRDLNYESTVMDLTEEDIIDNGDRSSLVITPRSDLFDLPNTIEAKFLSSDLNYIEEAYVLQDSDAITADNDERKETIDLLGLDLDNVQKMCNYKLERLRWGVNTRLAARDRTLSLECMDPITLTHTLPGWDEHDFRVVSIGFDNRTNQMALTLEEEKLALYDDDYNPSVLTRYATTLPLPSDPVRNVINVSATETVYYYRGRSFTRLDIDFDKPTNSIFWKHAEVWMRTGGSGDYKHITNVTSDYRVDPVEEGEEYGIKLRSVSIYGLKESLDTCYLINHTIIGVTSTPTNLSAMTAVANGDTISIYADPVSDPDIDGYEVRLGPAWDGAIFISFNKAPSLRLTGVRPGTHTFWLSPVRLGVSGNYIYSDTPVSATCTVFIPPGFSSVDSWSWDFDAIGTHDNTEHTTYNTEDALKCSHTSSVLTGTWTSPSRDLSSIQKVRAWAEVETDFESTDTTFDGVGGETLTFDDLGGQTLSFNEIFEPSAAGQLEITLQYSTDDSTYNDIDKFEILCAEVNARYLRIVVTITDPTLDANLYLYELPMKAYSGPQ